MDGCEIIEVLAADYGSGYRANRILRTLLLVVREDGHKRAFERHS